MAHPISTGSATLQVNEQFPSNDRVLRWREVRDRVGLSRATIWRIIRRGAFPPPVTLGPQSVGWMNAK